MERRLVSVQRWTCNSFCRGTYGRISEFSPGSARGPLGKGGSFSAGRLSSQIELLLRVLHLPPSHCGVISMNKTLEKLLQLLEG